MPVRATGLPQRLETLKAMTHQQAWAIHSAPGSNASNLKPSNDKAEDYTFATFEASDPAGTSDWEFLESLGSLEAGGTYRLPPA